MSDELTPEPTPSDESRSDLPEVPKTRLLQRLIPQTKSRRLIALASIVVLIGGITFGAISIFGHHHQPKQLFGAKSLPFKILSTTPSNGDKSLRGVAQIKINFSKPVSAKNLPGDFWITPKVAGTFSQISSNEATFTPDEPLALATVYSVMIHGEFHSNSGATLGADYHFAFTTATPDNSVVFENGDIIQTLGSVQAGTEQDFTLGVGDNVDPTGHVDVYQSDRNTLTNWINQNQLAGPTQDEGGLIVKRTIDTSSMTLVQTKKGLNSGDLVSVKLPVGQYAIVAMSGDYQVGLTWLNVTNLGVSVKEDDKQFVVALSDLTTQQPASAYVQLVNVQGSTDALAVQNINGVGSIRWDYSEGTPVDWIIASNATDFAITPVQILYSMADIRVNANLNKQVQVYGLTDKPTYTLGESVQFSGFVVADNDAHFAPIQNRTLELYVDTKSGDQTKLYDTSVTTDSNGMVSGSFTPSADWLTYVGITTFDAKNNATTKDVSPNSTNFTIYVKDGSSDEKFISESQFASFTVNRKAKPAADVAVKFANTDYLAKDKVAAKITVTMPDGTPFKNGKVALDWFSYKYDESSASQPQLSSDNPGDKINFHPIPVTLNSLGQATFPIDTSKLPAGSSQIVTVQARIAKDANGVVAGGGGSTTIHEANAKIVFGPSQGVISHNGNATARVYVESLDNQPIPYSTVDYSLKDANGKEIGSGEVTSDNTGLAEITQNIGDIDPATNPSVRLDVWSGDAEDNRIDNYQDFYIEDPGIQVAHSDLELSQLDVSGIPSNISVGQTLNLTINSPEHVRALVTISRDRIYQYDTLDLGQGDTPYTIVVTPDMMPSFNLSFDYFADGTNHTEGLTVAVSPANKEIALQINPDKNKYAAGDTATINLKSIDSKGNPLSSRMIIGVVNEKVYRLNSQPVADILGLYAPRNESRITSSSSLTGIGTGAAGGCGDGGNHWVSGDSTQSDPAVPDALIPLINPAGTSLYWNSQFVTGADGSGSIQVKLPKGTWRVFVYAIDQAVDVGSSYVDITTS